MQFSNMVNSVLLLFRGEILLVLNKPQEAMKCYEKALQLPDGNKSDIYYNIGKCFKNFSFYCCI